MTFSTRRKAMIKNNRAGKSRTKNIALRLRKKIFRKAKINRFISFSQTMAGELQKYILQRGLPDLEVKNLAAISLLPLQNLPQGNLGLTGLQIITIALAPRYIDAFETLEFRHINRFG